MKFRFYKIKVDSKYFYRLINNSKNISLHNLKQKNEIFSFDISYKNMTCLKSILEQLKIPIIECKDCGLYNKLFKKSIIRSFLLFIAIFLMFLLINSLFVWEITIDGNYSNSSDEIRTFIKQTINIGALKSEIDTEQLETSLRNNYNNISWVCAEIKGTNLLVHIKETYISEIADIEDKPYNLIANRDGTIVSIITRKGKAQVKVGDKVKKGDVLISGKVPVFSEYEEELFNSYYSADGTIKAKTNRSIEIKLDKEYTYKTKADTYHVYMPTYNEYSWNLKLKNKNITKETKKLRLWGDFYLPLAMEKYTVEEAEYETKAYTNEEAKEILNNKLLYKLSKMEQKDYKILKKDVKIVENEKSFILTCKFQCLEPLGKIEYISIEKAEEGTTNLNEYN